MQQTKQPLKKCPFFWLLCDTSKTFSLQFILLLCIKTPTYLGNKAQRFLTCISDVLIIELRFHQIQTLRFSSKIFPFLLLTEEKPQRYIILAIFSKARQLLAVVLSKQRDEIQRCHFLYLSASGSFAKAPQIAGVVLGQCTGYQCTIPLLDQSNIKVVNILITVLINK